MGAGVRMGFAVDQQRGRVKQQKRRGVSGSASETCTLLIEKTAGRDLSPHPTPHCPRTSGMISSTMRVM